MDDEEDDGGGPRIRFIPLHRLIEAVKTVIMLLLIAGMAFLYFWQR